MTKPLSLDDVARLPRTLSGMLVDGLSAATDAVADSGAATHRFLRYRWYAAALAAYGGAARTLVVEAQGVPVVAIPLVAKGPAAARLAAVPGCFWPFRGFALSLAAGEDALEVALDTLALHVNVLRIGPVYDGDVNVMPLIAAARARGWVAVPRRIATSHLLDMRARATDGGWPRNSTLRKNRFHEKHLASHGALDWSFVNGDGWADAFDAMAAIEARSWVAARTDGSDAKFTATGHGAFWRAAATDPVLAGMFRAALLRVAGEPAAFSFDIDAGALKYAIANSYDPAFAKHSPGKLLYWRNLVEAMARGVAMVDWGAGDSGYKAVIGADEGPAIRDWLLVRPGLPALAARAFGMAWRLSGN